MSAPTDLDRLLLERRVLYNSEKALSKTVEELAAIDRDLEEVAAAHRAVRRELVSATSRLTQAQNRAEKQVRFRGRWRR